MTRLIYIGLFLLLFTVPLSGRKKLSAKAEISILTCSQGEELYSAFGHSALRVKDADNNIDWVFNYGTFDFDTPWFYLKFANGNLDYLLSIGEYKRFLVQYFNEGRSVTEQVLNLNMDDKQKVFDALLSNYEPGNRNYRYDFFYDNCATRIVDMLNTNVHGELIFKPGGSAGHVSFRTLLHHYLKHSPWIETGLAMILGMPADKIATVRESTYLPYFLMQAFDHATIKMEDGQTIPMVKEKVKVFDFMTQEDDTIWTPVVFFWLLLFLSVVIGFFVRPKTLSLFDGLLFFVAGGIGLLIVFLWFISMHSVTGNNLNILWAMPTFVLLAFANHKHKWTAVIMVFNLFCLVVFLIGWKFIPQAFPAATIPIALLLGARLVSLLYKQRKLSI
ncbi:protein of unknown function [Saccharicrinis carchari]|uniref:Uncharacterized protein n=1 Tax=Saccharicrinis carchari TaxID=1168039 RepID=A0A521AV16_SACCC|nr:DUF4105 domain-containing protein [Saccharicrinis carchari]SMO38644.1 protein of unknown function [Saccharicrinis carchari]